MRTNRKLSEEHKQKISEAMRGTRNPNFGKTFSASHRQKISASLLNYWSKLE
ncbi:MAG: NUMOD3 domain-containing DNA-binding protein [Dysgonomonas sp.]|uniref:NUMOD3 domain-containing DNA-binding protein n=1 Tax=Dysgonomonas sp. TaxID=1891233 RepID=UPI0039E26923